MKNVQKELAYQQMLEQLNQHVVTPYVDRNEVTPYVAISKIDLMQGAFIMDAVEFVQTYLEYCNEIDFSGDYHRRYVVFVPHNVVLEVPIFLNLYINFKDDRQQITIIIAPGAHATVYDSISFLEINRPSIHRSIVCVVFEHAQLTLTHEQQGDSMVNCFSTVSGYVHSQATLHIYFLVMGAAFSQTIIDTHARGVGANIAVHGAYALSKTQQAQIATMQNHLVAGGTSTVSVNGVLAGNAQSVYHGTIFIDVAASSTCAAQKNKNILLSAGSRAHSLPILQVLNNDVQCAHGSAVGQLDAEHLLYMCARGIDMGRAQELLIEGFIGEELPEAYRDAMVRRVLKVIV